MRVSKGLSVTLRSACNARLEGAPKRLHAPRAPF